MTVSKREQFLEYDQAVELEYLFIVSPGSHAQLSKLMSIPGLATTYRCQNWS
jgi:hypothetical protein